MSIEGRTAKGLTLHISKSIFAYHWLLFKIFSKIRPSSMSIHTHVGLAVKKITNFIFKRQKLTNPNDIMYFLMLFSDLHTKFAFYHSGILIMAPRLLLARNGMFFEQDFQVWQQSHIRFSTTSHRRKFRATSRNIRRTRTKKGLFFWESYMFES